jgi:hypothetical protein
VQKLPLRETLDDGVIRHKVSGLYGNDVFKVFISLARSCALVFRRESPSGSQERDMESAAELDRAIRASRAALLHVWPENFKNRPNMLTGYHHADMLTQAWGQFEA